MSFYLSQQDGIVFSILTDECFEHEIISEAGNTLIPFELKIISNPFKFFRNKLSHFNMTSSQSGNTGNMSLQRIDI